MLAARALGVFVLAACGLAPGRPAYGQQQAGTIVPVVATFEAATRASKLPPFAGPYMPSRVAGNLADRLQALHEPAAAAEASRAVEDSTAILDAEAAARTPPSAASKLRSRPITSGQPREVSAAGSKPALSTGSTVSMGSTVSTGTQVSIVVPKPVAPPKRDSAPQQPNLRAANPLRGSP